MTISDIIDRTNSERKGVFFDREMRVGRKISAKTETFVTKIPIKGNKDLSLKLELKLGFPS